MPIYNGTVANDTLTGSADNDTLIGYAGNDSLLGGGGIDVALIASLSSEAVITRFDNYATHNSFVGLGIDILSDVEYVQYNDKNIRVKQVFLGEKYQSISEVENNSTYTLAQQLNVGTDYLITGNITSNDKDFFKLNLTQASDIELELGGMTNNLSLRLWNDFNNNGRVDSGEFHTNYQNGLAKEYIFRSNRWPGTWYAEIWSPTSGVSSPYQLRVSSQRSIGSIPANAFDLGNIVAGGNNWNKGQIVTASPKNVSVINATVGADDNQDWFKFSLSQKQKVTIDLNFLDNYGTAWVEVFDANMNRVGIADTANANEQLAKVLDAGNYYVKVFDQIGSSQNKYSLNIQTRNSANIYVDDNWADTAIGADPDGDGVAENFGVDSFASVQEAIDAANVGDIIDIAGGVYDEHLSLNKSISLQHKDSKHTAQIKSIHINGDSANGATIEGLKFNGASDGILVQAANVSIIDNKVENMSNRAIGSHAANNLLIENNQVYNSNQSISLYASSGTVRANQVYSSSATGISSVASDLLQIIDNSIYNSSSNAIHLHGNSNILVRGNNSNDSGGHGIYSYSNSARIEDNIITNASEGIYSQSGSINISGNQVSSSRSRGIVSFGDSDAIIDSNLIANSSSQGVETYSSNAVIKNNIIDSNNEGILVYYSNAQINHNQITNSRGRGIISFISTSSIKNNQIANSGNDGIQLYQSSGSIVESNQVSTSGVSGISNWYGNNNQILDNAISNSQSRGIIDYSSSDSKINNNRVNGASTNLYIGSASTISEMKGNDLSSPASWGIYSEAVREVSATNLTGSNQNYNVQFVGDIPLG